MSQNQTNPQTDQQNKQLGIKSFVVVALTLASPFIVLYTYKAFIATLKVWGIE